MYGRYEEESSWCSCKGLFKLLLLMVIAAVGLIGLFAYSNPDWEGWTVLAPVFPVRFFKYFKPKHVGLIVLHSDF